MERAEERRQREKRMQEGALRGAQVREELGGAGRRGDGERRGRCERCGGEAGSSREHEGIMREQGEEGVQEEQGKEEEQLRPKVSKPQPEGWGKRCEKL